MHIRTDSLGSPPPQRFSGTSYLQGVSPSYKTAADSLPAKGHICPLKESVLIAASVFSEQEDRRLLWFPSHKKPHPSYRKVSCADSVPQAVFLKSAIRPAYFGALPYTADSGRRRRRTMIGMERRLHPFCYPIKDEHALCHFPDISGVRRP